MLPAADLARGLIVPCVAVSKKMRLGAMNAGRFDPRNPFALSALVLSWRMEQEKARCDPPSLPF
jgi:hypothetical protein